MKEQDSMASRDHEPSIGSALEKPRRVQLSRTKGWRMPPNTVKVDRTTRWGNPFVAGAPNDMRQARRWGWSFKPRTKGLVCPNVEMAVRRFGHCLALDEATHPFVREQLGGKNLACWCALGEPCHADMLLELANAPSSAKQVVGESSRDDHRNDLPHSSVNTGKED